MAKTKEKKSFNTGVYAVVSGIAVAVVLVIVTVFAFATRYTAFAPEKVAQSYVDTIIQTGDGYNAYKLTLVSKNSKYGDFIRNAYMAPFVNTVDEKGEDVPQADFVSSGSQKNEEEQKAIDTVYATMYDYYCELIKTLNGLDNYDTFFTSYFEKLVEVRHEVYGDDYMDTDYMFGVFEANVASYGDSLTGTQNVFASDDKTLIKEQSTGLYQTMFGEEKDVEVDKLVDGKKQTVTEKQLAYKLTATVTETKELSDEEVAAYIEAYKGRIEKDANSGESRADTYGLTGDEKESMIDAFAKLDCSEDITAVTCCTVEITNQKGEVVAKQLVNVVAIGSSWYVDNTNIDTSGLYF